MNQPTNQTIRIEKITDLLALDDRQFEACLKDLRTWLVFRRDLDQKVAATKELLAARGIPPEHFDVETQDFMGWVDDGIDGGEVNVELVDKDTGETVLSGTSKVNVKGEVVQ